MRSLIQHEVKYYFKNRIELFVITILFLSFFLLTPFSLRDSSKHLSVLQNTVLWLALQASFVLASSNLYARDLAVGRLEYYQLMPMALEMVVLAKWLGCYLSIMIPISIALPFMWVLSGAAEPLTLLLYGKILAGAAALSAICNLAAAIMAGAARGTGSMIGLVVLPLSIPVIIFGSEATRNPDTSGAWFLVGLACFMVPLMCLAGASSIRSGN